MPPTDLILDLYHRAFPPTERRSDDAILASIRSPSYRILTASVAAQFAGFAIIFIPENESFALLEYLAIDPAHQGHGVGSRLFQDVIVATRDRHLLIEVEAAQLGPDAVRRQMFYERAGCVKLHGFRYILPLPDGPPMELMIRRFDDNPLSLERWLRVIYELVYACSATDPRIDGMLNQCWTGK